MKITKSIALLLLLVTLWICTAQAVAIRVRGQLAARPLPPNGAPALPAVALPAKHNAGAGVLPEDRLATGTRPVMDAARAAEIQLKAERYRKNYGQYGIDAP